MLRRVLVLAVLNVVLCVGLQGMLAWEAHLGGFLAGLACGCWLEGRVERERARRPRRGPARSATRPASSALARLAPDVRYCRQTDRNPRGTA